MSLSKGPSAWVNLGLGLVLPILPDVNCDHASVMSVAVLIRWCGDNPRSCDV